MADGVEVGHAYVSISASGKGAVKQVREDFARGMPGAGKEAGGRLGGGLVAAASKFAAPLAAAFTGAKLVGFLTESVAAASDLNEAGTKTEAIFGKKGSAALAKFAEGSAQKLGQTKLQVLDAAGTFGTFGKAAGLAGGDLVKFSTGFSTLSTDLASFYNAKPEEAAEAISAGLRGEAEPLRKYGILLDDATLRQEALKQGPTRRRTGLTPQQKVLAAQAVIYKQTKDAQGDSPGRRAAWRTEQRILSAQVDPRLKKPTWCVAACPIMVKLVSFVNSKLAGNMDKVVAGFEAAVTWSTRAAVSIAALVQDGGKLSPSTWRQAKTSCRQGLVEGNVKNVKADDLKRVFHAGGGLGVQAERVAARVGADGDRASGRAFAFGRRAWPTWMGKALPFLIDGIQPR